MEGMENMLSSLLSLFGGGLAKYAMIAGATAAALSLAVIVYQNHKIDNLNQAVATLKANQAQLTQGIEEQKNTIKVLEEREKFALEAQDKLHGEVLKACQVQVEELKKQVDSFEPPLNEGEIDTPEGNLNDSFKNN